MTLHQPTLRVIKVLETLKNYEKGLNISQLSKTCEISAGTLHPILKTLCDLNYLKCIEKNYTLTKNADFEQKKAIKVISFYADALSKELDLGVQVAQLCGANIIYIHKTEAKKIVLKTKIGDIANANATALGKALLLEKSKEDLEKIFTTLNKNTKKTIDSISKLYENLSFLKTLGYTYEIGEFDDDFACFAVPIYKNGEIFVSISVTLLIFHLNSQITEKIAKKLLSYKAKIEQEINL